MDIKIQLISYSFVHLLIWKMKNKPKTCEIALKSLSKHSKKMKEKTQKKYLTTLNKE